MSERGHHPLRGLARGLGWASLGLGVAQIAAPNAVRRLSGVDDSAVARVMVPVTGVRELMLAAVLLGGRAPERWAWTRVAGDVVDLTALGLATGRRRRTRRRRATAATVAVAGVTAVDVCAAVGALRRPSPSRLTVHAAITVLRPRTEVYRFWRDLENLPSFMTHLMSVRVMGEGRSIWAAAGPAGRTVEWEAQIIEDRPDELIAWRSTGGAAVRGGGLVRFTDAPGGRGTEVRVELRHGPRGGVAGAALARLFGERPDQRVRDDLRRFKQVMETGEVLRSEGAPEGGRAIRPARRRPARRRPARPVMTGGAR